MSVRLWLFSFLALFILNPLRAIVAADHAEARSWFDRFQSAGPLPFSFTYDGRPSEALLSTWATTSTQRNLDAQRQERVLTFTDPKTGLEIRCVAVAYRDFPTVEWTVFFKNNGQTDTPILDGIQALQAKWPGAEKAAHTLHYSSGTLYPPAAGDFMPQTSVLKAGQPQRLTPINGRPTCGIMPYFNIERGDNSGLIMAVGWPGAWAAEFSRDAKGSLTVTAGQEITHLRLHPGEEIRTPLIALLFWRGDWIDGQNTWRRWMLAHNVPLPFGQPRRPLLAASSAAQFAEMIQADEANQLAFIDRYLEEKFPIDFWWMDAGWYENNGRWQEPIAWRVDKKRFPGGLRAITDHAHARGVKSIVWFEPERVMPTNEFFKEHPDWLIVNPTPGLISRLLYLGNPAARTWLIDLLSRRITEEGIDVYRQDFNIVEPVAIWRQHDTADRQGITENHHVTGYLAVYDELLRRHPGLVIDSCAGGGSRNDLETMRRALPFWRSDYAFDLVSNQSQSYGLALWLPFFGTANGPQQFSSYELRSNFTSPLMVLACDMRDKTVPYDDLRKAVREWRDYAQNFTGDFYPLTPDSIAADVWLAWQFNRPETGRGVIQAFRRDASIYQTARVKLRGLESAAHYRFTDLDAASTPQEFSGQELMTTGLDLTITAQPGAAILTYEKLP